MVSLGKFHIGQFRSGENIGYRLSSMYRVTPLDKAPGWESLMWGNRNVET